MPFRRPSAGPGWLPGIDGLRAVAVLAVMVFHFDSDLLRGGFLGVDLIFAISGFLITRMLLSEVAERGRIGVLTFYRRRWRRLMPAAFAVLGAVAVASLTFWRDELVTLRSGLLASAGFVTNWWLIYDKQSYFVAAGRPPMVQHLWSLAVEEQFYLVWPFLLGILVGPRVLRRTRSGDEAATRRGLTVAERAAGVKLTHRAIIRVAVTCTTLAIASGVLMAVLADHYDIPYGQDSSRVYFGTDTHASGLLFGAALGALSLWRRPDSAREWKQRRGHRAGLWMTDVLALALLALLGWQLWHVNEFDPALYRGGFAVIGLIGALLVAALARPGARLGRWLDVGPMRWIGQRSYSLYLWHWPVAVVTRPRLDVTGPGWLLIVNQFVITFLLAELSYRLIETPFRSGAARRWWTGQDRSTAARTPSSRRVGTGAVRTGAGARWLTQYWSAHQWLTRRMLAWGLSAAVLLTALAAARGHELTPVRHRADANAQFGAGAHATRIDTVTMPSTSSASTAGASSSSAAPTASTPSAPGTASASKVRPTVQPSTPNRSQPAPTPRVTAFGDSVMLGAAGALATDLPGIGISAVEGRQARDLFDDIDQRCSAHALAPVVVIHTGDNGIIAASDLSGVLSRLRDRQRVVLITPRVDRDWEGPNLDTLRTTARQFPNTRLLDWNAISAPHPDWFYSDGIHLPPLGAQEYARLVTAAVRAP